VQAEALAAPVATHAPAPGEALAAQQAEAIAMLRRVIENATTPLRWPMYVRNVKQLLRAADSSFDERRYGFGGILDLLRASQRDAVLRLERDRQGVLRVFQGSALQRPADVPPVQEATVGESQASPAVPFEEPVAAHEPEGQEGQPPTEAPEPRIPAVIDAQTVEGAEPPGPVDGQAAGEEPGAKPKRKRAAAGARKTAAPRKPRTTPAKPRAKKKSESLPE
jgi:hypothetical protein